MVLGKLMLVAGIDSSTQSTKVVVCDAATGVTVREGRASHPEGTEVPPAAWWQAFQEATAGGLLDDVECIGVAGQQHGLVALDGDGEPVRDALLWNDTRSARAAADLVDELGAATWAERTGSVPLASFTITKLRWLQRHEPDLAQRVRSVLLPHDWLGYRLTNRMATDRGDASGTGYWSPQHDRWDTELLTHAFGRTVGLPTLLAPHEPLGRTQDGVLVSAGTGDNMAAALGLGIEVGDVVVSIGTSGTVFGVTDRPTADPDGIVAGFADATGRFLPLVCTLNAARVLTATAAMLGVDLSELDRLALAAEPGAEGLDFVPYLDGERTPNLPDATGTLSGMTRGNMTPRNMARAAVEGMLTGLVAGLDALRDNGVTTRRVLLIGGGARSRAVQEIAPLIFGVPVTVPEPAEYVALGAARQAAWALTGALPTWHAPVR
ncbi:xylulokinase [Lentzea sp. NBRC 105346]|uniref:xylulokinase n=1 Tax=Lentzea sp. NBRC 105346 TaxID=3032205 RepID=UPI00249F96E0|nr:xylulokinase [Lentzea sp. NBRC 105346]GLZ34256.1 xylulokinase [Lentzea sp. NBRC 105346]